MPEVKNIVVTGANGRVGTRLVPRLSRAGHHVVALTRGADVDGASEVVKMWPKNPRSAEAISVADVIVNLTGEINPPTDAGYMEANVEPAARIKRALGHRQAKQTLFISFPGADPRAANLFLKSKGEGERLTQEAGEKAAIFRVSSIVGTPEAPLEFEKNLQTPAGKPGRSFGSGQCRLSPVLIDDVVDVLIAAIDQQTEGVFALETSEKITLDDFIRAVNQDALKTISHTPGALAVLLAPFIGMRRDMVRLFLADALDAKSPNAFTALGLQAATLKSVWRSKTLLDAS